MTRHTMYAVLGVVMLLYAFTLRTVAGNDWGLALLIVVGLGLVLASGDHQQTGRRR